MHKHKSCGQCTRRSEDTTWMMNMMDRFAGGCGRGREIDTLLEFMKQTAGRTISTLGDVAAWPIQGLMRPFRPGVEARIAMLFERQMTGDGSPTVAAADNLRASLTEVLA